MILIAGSTHDDILYFENVLYNKEEVTILNRYKAYKGTILTQEVMVIEGLFSSILSSAIISNILEHYFVDLVVIVGRCIGGEASSKNGDIVISTRIIDANTDMSDINEVVRGQIPGFARDFNVQTDVVGYLKEGINRRSFVKSYSAVFLSSNNLSPEVIDLLKNKKSIYGVDNERIVIDNNSSGIALAATLKDVPYVAIKVVENQIGKENSIDSYSSVLDRYIDLGKAVLSMVNDIGRNDVLR